MTALVSYFSLSGADEYWVAMGLSDSGTMEGSQITACTLSNNKISVVQMSGYSHGVSPVVIRSSLTSQVTVTKTDEYVTCKFYLHKSLFDGENKHLFVGSGQVKDNSILYHLATPLVSEEKISLSDDEQSTISVQITDFRILLHASAMITGYGVFMVVGIYTSRYLKPIFEKAWFKIHTNIMYGMVFLVAVGLGSIMLKEPTTTTGLHEIIGFLIIALTIFQIILASCRPYQKHRTRRIVMFGHLFIACFLFILVVINIFLGLSKVHLKIPSHIFVIQGIYVVWVVFGSIVGNEVLKYFYSYDQRVYTKKLKVYTIINIGIILMYGCTIIILLNVVE